MIDSIHITNYKNIEDQIIRFDGNIVAILGDNGMGKTNILDAVYYTCIGKSYFSAGDRNIVRKESDFFRLKAKYVESRETNVVVKYQLGHRKAIEVNGVKLKKAKDLVGGHPVVIIAPIDVQLLMEGSLARRKFINNSIVQYSKEYLNALLKYNRLLSQRNALLKQYSTQRRIDETLLESISDRMFDPATILYEYRKDLVDRLSPIFEEKYKLISGGREEALIQYRSQLKEDTLSGIFQGNMERDMILGRSTGGVHRDDMTFVMNDGKLKTFASQGQLKTFVIALKLAQYELLRKSTEKTPILLLDDLFDKLDTKRVKYLLDMITSGDYGKIILTDTDHKGLSQLLKEMDKVDYSILKIAYGKVI